MLVKFSFPHENLAYILIVFPVPVHANQGRVDVKNKMEHRYGDSCASRCWVGEATTWHVYLSLNLFSGWKCFEDGLFVPGVFLCVAQ